MILAQPLFFLEEKDLGKDLLWRILDLAFSDSGAPSPAMQLLLGYFYDENAPSEQIINRFVLKAVLDAVGCSGMLWSDIPYTNRPRWDVYVKDASIKDPAAHDLGRHVENLDLVGVANHLAGLTGALGFLFYADVQYVVQLSYTYTADREKLGYEATLYQKNAREFDWSEAKDKFFSPENPWISRYLDSPGRLADRFLHSISYASWASYKNGSPRWLSDMAEIPQILTEISAAVKRHLPADNLLSLLAALRQKKRYLTG
ncbi:MAG: hypothetical protein HYU30_02020 [Chloroflexi bacterium]|nr:hypothetical protein [Chloroflexota bacterium]